MLLSLIGTALVTVTSPAPRELADTASARDADAVVAAAFAAPAGPSAAASEAVVPASSSAASLWLPALALAALAAAAFVLSRKKRTSNGLVQILETASLGPKRALIVAQVHGETLLLGSSEAGITLLSVKPAPNAGAATAQPKLFELGSLESAERVTPEVPLRPETPLQAALGSLFNKKGDDPSFEQALEEAGEDQDLRAKLAAGMRGRKP